MKSMKGRFLKKLKFIPTITTLKHGLISHQNLQIPSVYILEDESGEKEKKITALTLSMDGEEYPCLSHFEEKCPPGGSESVILYTTSLRSIRKTFEDCHTILFLLESFKVMFYERDVSMHKEYREELWKIMGGRVIPPRLFIRGRYIGGADEVVSFHEQGKLKILLQGIPQKLSNFPCVSCANQRFLVCSTCNGCRKFFADGETHDHIRCPDCNENGLVKCTICT